MVYHVDVEEVVLEQVLVLLQGRRHEEGPAQGDAGHGSLANPEEIAVGIGVAIALDLANNSLQ